MNIHPANLREYEFAPAIRAICEADISPKFKWWQLSGIAFAVAHSSNHYHRLYQIVSDFQDIYNGMEQGEICPCIIEE